MDSQDERAAFSLDESPNGIFEADGWSSAFPEYDNLFEVDNTEYDEPEHQCGVELAAGADHHQEQQLVQTTGAFPENNDTHLALHQSAMLSINSPGADDVGAVSSNDPLRMAWNASGGLQGLDSIDKAILLGASIQTRTDSPDSGCMSPPAQAENQMSQAHNLQHFERPSSENSSEEDLPSATTPNAAPQPRATEPTRESESPGSGLRGPESQTTESSTNANADAEKIAIWEATRKMVTVTTRTEDAEDFGLDGAFMNEKQIWDDLNSGSQPLLEGKVDDWQSVHKLFSQYISIFWNAMKDPPVANPRPWSDAKQDGYEAGQENARRTLIHMTKTKRHCELAVTQIKALVLAAIKLHANGVVPDRVILGAETARTSTVGCAMQTGMKCSERLIEVIKFVAGNKLIAEDVLKGEHEVVLFNPKEALRRKLANVGTNTGKREDLQLAKTMKNATPEDGAPEPQTVPSAGKKRKSTEKSTRPTKRQRQSGIPGPERNEEVDSLERGPEGKSFETPINID